MLVFNAMRKFLTKIGILFFILVIIDVALGYGFKYMVINAKGGSTANNYSICNKITDDILIFGSSRAIHHYDPSILEDSLKLSCYNCGRDGNGIILAYGRYKMMKKRYTPAVVLYEVTPSFDIYKNDIKDLISLSYYYDYEGVDSIFWDIDKRNRIKMLSKMYRYSASPLGLVVDNIKPFNSYEKGYLPLDGVMDYDPIPKKDVVRHKIDTIKLQYLEKLIQECKAGGTRLIFLISPHYKATNEDEYTAAMELAERYDVPFLNHHSDTVFTLNKKYFRDSSHMNRDGATEYTKRVASEIKKLLN